MVLISNEGTKIRGFNIECLKTSLVFMEDLKFISKRAAEAPYRRYKVLVDKADIILNLLNGFTHEECATTLAIVQEKIKNYPINTIKRSRKL